MANSAPALLLVFNKGPRNGESLQCKPGVPTRIGRVVKGNTIAIKDPGISQKHLVVQFLPETSRWAVSDLETSNGTLLNGKPVSPSARSPLSDGDTIKIGESTSILVKIAAPEPPCPAPVAEDEVALRPRRRRGRAAAAAVPAAVFEKEEASDLVPEEVIEVEPARNVERGRGRPKKAAASAPVAEEGNDSMKADDPAVVSEKDEILQTIAAEEVEVVKIAGKGTGRGRGRGRGPTTRAALSRALEAGGPSDPVTITTTEDPAAAEEVNAGVETNAGDGDKLPEAGETGLGAEEVGKDWENMTLAQWFDRMEIFLPKTINDVADEIIADLRDKARRFDEYIAECSNDKMV